MARIRTLKPEFWTDEIVVQLPFEARLLFIGLWNFADDHGGFQDSPERIRMQIFPGEVSVDVPVLLELLVAAGLLERWLDDAGNYALKVKNWSKHQRVDNPGKIRVIGEGYRKLAIRSEERRGLAIKYGCKPGETKDVTCFFCGLPGQVYWHRLSSGRPSAWVCFPGLEIDHAEPEFQGGENTAKNLVLSCRHCNRSRGTRPGISFITRGMLDSSSESPEESREPSDSPRGSLIGKGREKEREGKGAYEAHEPRIGIVRGNGGEPSQPSDADEHEAWQSVQALYPDGAGRVDWIGAEHAARRLVEQAVATWGEISDGVTRYAAHCRATNRIVMNPVKFFTDKDSPWRQEWPLPKSKAETITDANEASFAEAKRRLTAGGAS